MIRSLPPPADDEDAVRAFVEEVESAIAHEHSQWLAARV